MESNNHQKDILERSELPIVSAESEATTTYDKNALTLELTSTTVEDTNISKTQEMRLEKEHKSNMVTINTPLESECGVVTPCENSDSGSIISMSSSYTDISSIKGAKAEDGDNSSVKSKKRRSFFNFRRSKKDQKKEVIL